MSNVWGRNLQLTIFGESHGSAIGLVMGGLPPGLSIDWAQVDEEMSRRAPGNSPLVTSRRESDQWEVLSGVFQNKTTGTPLSIIIRNEDADSDAYHPHLLRPGHADLASLYKYHGYADYRGGGHFSGRLTAPLVLAGAIAKQILRGIGIAIGARIVKIFDIADAAMTVDHIVAVSKKPFPVFDDAAGVRMQQAILRAKAERDSLGGVIECAALGIPRGWGDPFFDSLESSISSLMFSIPAVKGIEFGEGFNFANLKGSEANDQLYMDKNNIEVKSNHNGGINGGIANGQPLVFRTVVKPTPTIGRTQTTVDLQKKETVTAAFEGRHDPCIVPRAVPVIEAGLAISLLDFYLAGQRREELL